MVRSRIPADAIAELSDQRLYPEQATKLNLKLLPQPQGVRGWGRPQ
jgi:hypothetical protein